MWYQCVYDELTISAQWKQTTKQTTKHSNTYSTANRNAKHIQFTHPAQRRHNNNKKHNTYNNITMSSTTLNSSLCSGQWQWCSHISWGRCPDNTAQKCWLILNNWWLILNKWSQTQTNVDDIKQKLLSHTNKQSPQAKISSSMQTPITQTERSMSWKKDTQNNKDLNIAQRKDAITKQTALQLNWNEILHTRNYECIYYVCV